MIATVAMGLTVGVLALLYAESTGRNASEVLYSGQSALGGLLAEGATYAVGSLLVLIVCKALAYAASLSAFREAPSSRRCSWGRRAGSRCRTCPA